ncbi:BTAD domain-containing putative transcriptional regulator [Fodinibacter luteus]
MAIAVLGPLEVSGASARITPRDRVVLAALSLRPGTVRSVDALAEALWGERPPPSGAKIVQGCVVRLRRALGTRAVTTAPQGYRLNVPGEDLDHVRFERLAGRAREALDAGEPDRAAYLLDEALRLWRGQPFPDLGEWAEARGDIEHLVELHDRAREDLVDATVRTGGDGVAEAVRLVAEAPFRERRWALLAIAQYRAGRQQDALTTLARARTTLVEELGLDPGPELRDLERAVLAQDEALASQAALPPPTPHCPYPGLVAYDVTDTAVFYGREADTSSCLRRLATAGVLAVVGPSGIGKSSVVRAGVAATLVADGTRVDVVTPGRHPLDVLRGVGPGRDDVLVVDQLEEVLSPEVPEDERTAFLTALVERAGSGRPLVLSLRADRIGDLGTHPGMAGLLERGLVLLGPMSAGDLRRAVEGPAGEAGLRVEAGLVDLLVAEVDGEPGALPLLAHVLRSTWAQREGRVLTLDGYRRSGGVRDAVARTAESVYRTLDPEGRRAVRDLLLRLVSPGPDGVPVANRLPTRAVPADAAHTDAVERLLRARLLGSDGETVSVAHEAVADAWPRLRSWLDDDVEGQRIMRHLAVTADSWDELGRPESELYRGSRLSRTRDWIERARPSLTTTEDDFLEASTDLARREAQDAEERLRRERRLTRRLYAGLATVAVLLAVSVLAGTAAISAADRADRQATVADARRLGAEALRTPDLDRALLLAAAGVGLDDSLETRNNLLTSLARGSALAGSARASGGIFGMSVDGSTGQLAVAAPSGAMELYDGQSLRRVAVADGLSAKGVVSSPDRELYAVSKADVEIGNGPAVVLVDHTLERSPVQLGGQPEDVYAWDSGFSPNGRWFAVSLIHLRRARPPVTGVWDLRSPSRPVAVLELEAQAAPTVSDDGRTLYTVGNGTLQVTDLPSGAVRRVVEPEALRVRELGEQLAQSPDGRRLAVGAGVEAVLVDRETLEPQAYLPGEGWVSGLAFSPDGRQLAASGERLAVWDVSGPEPTEILRQEGPTDVPGFSSDGQTVYTAHGNLIQAWDLSGTRRFLARQPGEVLAWDAPAVGISPDRRRIGYAATIPLRFRVRDLVTGGLGKEVVAEGMEHGTFFDLAWHPDGTLLTITSGAPEVRTWDAATGHEVARHRLGPPGSEEGASVARFSLDGRHLLVGTTTGRLHVLDGHTLVPARDPIQVFPPDEDSDSDSEVIVSFGPGGDGRTAFVGNRVVDYRDGTVRPLPDLGDPAPEVVASPDGRRLMVSAGAAGVGLLDTTTMQWISRPDPAQAGLVGARSAFSQDGSLFASSSSDHLSYWNAATGALLGSSVVDVEGAPAFSADNSALTLAGTEGSVLTWNLDPRSWVRTACQLAGRELTEEEWRSYLGERPYEPVCRG